jgi:hypothetical protein
MYCNVCNLVGIEYVVSPKENLIQTNINRKKRLESH